MRISQEVEERILAMPGVVVNGQTIEAPKLHECHGEAAFQRAVTDLAKANGWKWHHHQISKRSKSGWPDLVMWRDYVLFRELKNETGVASASQLTTLEGLADAGADVGLWRPSDWTEIVKTLTAPRRAK